jgi:hypothetical protein
LRKTDASKLPEERFFQVVGIEICSPSAPGREKYTLLCSTNDPATA